MFIQFFFKNKDLFGEFFFSFFFIFLYVLSKNLFCKRKLLFFNVIAVILNDSILNVC